MKQRPNLNVYLVLLDNDSILLSKRANTGYEDNKWSLVSGHAEAGELATASLIREAQEEIGIAILPEAIQVVHVMHRKTDRDNIDLFMQCQCWSGSLVNKEPHKCSGLKFFKLSDLPIDTVQYIKDALLYIQNGQFFSELSGNEV